MLLHGVAKTPTIADVYKATGVVGDKYTTGGQLIKAASKWGLAMSGKYFSLETLRQELDSGRGIIPLIHYGTFSSLGKTESPFRGPHFLVISGYDQSSVIVHDPLWRGIGGRFKAWPNDIFYSAWEQSKLDKNPAFWGLITANATYTKLPPGTPSAPAIPIFQNPNVWGTGIVLTSALRLRHHPIDGQTILYLKAGDTVDILEPKRDGWLHVSYNGIEGWCGGNPAYITAIQAPPITPTPPPSTLRKFDDLTQAEKNDLLEKLLVKEGLVNSEGRILE
jgi:hypothetical protein